MAQHALDDSDPVARALASAPVDDRPETDEERELCSRAMSERKFMSSEEMSQRLEAWRIAADEQPLADDE